MAAIGTHLMQAYRRCLMRAERGRSVPFSVADGSSPAPEDITPSSSCLAERLINTANNQLHQEQQSHNTAGRSVVEVYACGEVSF